MRSSPVSLYLRVRSPEGGWLYARSVTASNGRIRPLHALIDGKPVYRDEGVYHLRYSLNGKRIWQPIGIDASLAQVALQRKTVELQAVTLGLAIPELILPELATPEPAPSQQPKQTSASPSQNTWPTLPLVSPGRPCTPTLAH